MKIKRIAAFAGIAAVTIILLEIASFFIFRFLSTESLDLDTVQQQRDQRITWLRNEVSPDKSLDILYSLHPYVGYVGRPGQRPWNENYPPFNQYGMLSVPGHAYPYKRGDEDFIIAVLGGSVAEGFANLGGEQAIQETLDSLIPGFQRRVVMINLATGGYKQPQQLIHLQYALLAGFEFDLVINLDGLNELVGSESNSASRVNPIFPSVVHTAALSQVYAGSRIDPATIEHLHRYYALYTRELWLLSQINRWPMRYSPFMNTLGLAWTLYTERAAGRLKFDFAATGAESGMQDDFRGPASESGWNHQSAARTWAQASRMLDAICRANKILYIHALQPNQYVIDSKEFSSQELENAFDPESDIALTVRKGYPYLFEQGRLLAADNIPFYDLTDVYKEQKETIYMDDCCHFGELGSIELGHRLGQIAAQMLQQSSD